MLMKKKIKNTTRDINSFQPTKLLFKKLKMFKEKKTQKYLSPEWLSALTYLFLSRDRCVGVALPSARVISCLSRVALGRAEFTAATVLQIRLGGGSGSTSVTAVTCLVRVF